MGKSTTSQLHINCPNCGSPEVAYSAKEQALHCNYCDYTKALPNRQDEIIERALEASFSLEDAPRGLQVESHVFHCEGCGSDISVSKETVNFSCPFCGSEHVNEKAVEQRVIQPSGLLPFTVPKEEAILKFKNWIGRGWFRPNNLSKLARVQNLQGIYLPFWTYDAYTESQWHADAGYYYYENRTVRGPDGKPMTQTVQKIRWRPASGYYEHFFDDVLVCASHGISQSGIERIYPFPLKELINYDSRYVLGWETEIYQKNIREGFNIADQIMDQQIRHACASRIPGDTYRHLRVRTQKDGLTFKHILLPVWVAGYRYKGKVFQFLVNGQSGKVSGSKPWSWPKIIIAVILGAIALGALFYYLEMNQ